MEEISKILKERITVNREENGSLTDDSKTVISSDYNRKSLDVKLENIKQKNIHFAKDFAAKLNDTNNIAYYICLIKAHPFEVLLEALSSALDAEQNGKLIREKKYYFQGILRNKGYRTKFSKE